MKKNNYRTFMFTLLISFLLMYAIMYLNVAEPSHVFMSMTRCYMTLLMVAAMAILMLLMMPGMYGDRKRNITIIGTSAAVFLFSLAGVRSQTGIGDIQYMKGMIPHHSIAILTSSRAEIKDPRVRKLADGIIQTQEKEIAQMKALIDSLKRGE